MSILTIAENPPVEWDLVVGVVAIDPPQGVRVSNNVGATLQFSNNEDTIRSVGLATKNTDPNKRECGRMLVATSLVVIACEGNSSQHINSCIIWKKYYIKVIIH